MLALTCNVDGNSVLPSHHSRHCPAIVFKGKFHRSPKPQRLVRCQKHNACNNCDCSNYTSTHTAPTRATAAAATTTIQHTLSHTIQMCTYTMPRDSRVYRSVRVAVQRASYTNNDDSVFSDLLHFLVLECLVQIGVLSHDVAVKTLSVQEYMSEEYCQKCK